MPKSIVHAGMHETGVTAIQNALKTLDTPQHRYARLGGSPNHSAAIRSMFAADTQAQRNAAPDATAAQREAAANRKNLKDEIAAAGERTLILSAEAIMNLQEAELQALHSFLTRNHLEPRIVAYVCDPVTFMNSAFQRRLANGKLDGFSASDVYPNYRKKFDRLDTVFGRDNVTLWKFDPAADAAQDFCSRCEIELGTSELERSPAQPSRAATLLMYRLGSSRKQGPRAAEQRLIEKQLRAALSELTGSRFRLSPSLLQPVLEESAADIGWMENRLGEPLPRDPGAAQPGDIASEADLLLTRDEIRQVMRHVETAFGNGDERRSRVLQLLTETLESVQPGDKAAWRAALGKTPASAPVSAKPTAAAVPSPKVPPSKPDAPAKAKPPKRGPPAGPVSIFSADPKNPKPALPPLALVRAPIPLLNKDKRLIVLWSPKSACTTTYVWFSHLSGFSNEVRHYAAWPHRHRIEQFQRSPFFAESAKSDLSEMRVLRIIRDPYSRAVSIYRHALQTHFADAPMRVYSNGKIDADDGYSFQTFLDFVAQLDMTRVDIHFRPQLHPYEAHRVPDKIINISKQDLIAELGSFEESNGLARTDFEELSWLHDLESKRRAKQDPITGDDIDKVPFTRHQVHKLGHFPSYSQLLTPKAKTKIESIYAADFDAYADYL